MDRVLYFSSLPDRIGRGVEEFFLSKNVKSTRELLAYLRLRGEECNKALQERKVKITGNKEFLELDDAIMDDDEIAIISVGLT
ncbi:MAG: MoaD/ThiS family protein [Gammaproteobacteria bacterium]|nr:MoaD/ThiS family protein [Gammaproteobacteria bacterium]